MPRPRPPAPSASPAPAVSTHAGFDAIYMAHADAIYYLALRLTSDPSVAEDVTHDVFLKAFRARDEFRGTAAVRTWLYRITINHSHNLRARWYHRSMVNNADEVIEADTAAPRAVSMQRARHLEL